MDGFKKINFLYQASILMNEINDEKLSKNYINVMKKTCKRKVIRMLVLFYFFNYSLDILI